MKKVLASLFVLALLLTLALPLSGFAQEEESDSSLNFSFAIPAYDPPEIQATEVTAPELDFSAAIPAYDPPEIQAAEVKPLDPIEFELPAYDPPDISAFVPQEVEPFYIEIASSFDEIEQQQVAALSEIELAGIVRTQYDLIGELVAAFGDAGLEVDIDPYSGTIPIDAALLYDTDKYEVTDAGKEVLGEIFRLYCSVLSQEQYRDHVARIVIHGHTDTAGSYEYNLELSRKRAEAVRDFCLSEECGVEDPEWLAPLLVAEGHSYDEPIRNADGSVNMDASRRVELSFDIAWE